MAHLAHASGAGRRKPLGIWTSTALVVGNMIGSGVFLLPAALAAYGGVSLVGWLVTAAGALALALVFSRLTRALPKVGGPYAYSRLAFGDFMGFLVAWGYWIAIWVGNAAIAVAFVGYLAVFWPALAADQLLAALAALAAIWVLTIVNTAGVRAGGLVQLVTTVLKMVPLALVGLLGLFFLDGANFTPFNPSGESTFGAITSVAALTLWAFIGLESVTIPADDVDDPERTIPRATALGTIAVAAIYIVATAAIMGMVPAAALGASTAPFADAAEIMLGPWARWVVAAGAVISTFGCLNGWVLLQGQIPLAAARDGVFPAAFGNLSARGVPVLGLVVSSVLVSVLMLFNYQRDLVDLFGFIVLLATLTTLVPYLFTAIGAVLIYRRMPDKFGAATGGATVIALFAFLYALWTIYGAGQEVAFWGVLLLFAGTPIYVWLKWDTARTEQPAT